MDPKEKARLRLIEILYKKYRDARARGHMGTAVRLLDRITRLENLGTGTADR